MTIKAISAAVAGVFVAAAVAAPRESVTFTNVDSVGLRGNPANLVRTAQFAGSDAGGAYTTRMLHVSGLIFDSFGTSTWGREAVIEITPPGGQPFLCIPYDLANYVGFVETEAGRYTVPLAPVTTGGVWSFRFAETYDDDPTGPDQTWSTITFTLDDGAPPPIDAPIGGTTTTFTGVTSNGSPGVGSTVLTRTFTNPGYVNRVQILGRLTVRDLVSVDNTGNLPTQARVRITPPAASGVAPFDIAPVTSPFSTCVANAIVDIPAAPSEGLLMAGTWNFEFYDASDDPIAIDAYWQDVSITLQNTNPPAAFNIGALPDGGGAAEDTDFRSFPVAPQPGVVNWFRFSVPGEVSPASGAAIDIDMVGTASGPQNDFSLGLYSGAGNLIAWSYDTGPGSLPQISVGSGTRPRAGDGLPYEGQNQTVSPLSSTANVWPALPAGESYIAVCSGDDGAVFTSEGWQVAPSTEANGPAATLRVRYYSTAPWAQPADPVELPTLPAVLRGTVNIGTDFSDRFRWLRFTVPAAVGPATGHFLDIDTNITYGVTYDTSIALYDSNGELKAFNNDLGVGGPLNPNVRNSALSFGATTPTRDYRALDGNMPLGNGRHGQLTPGVYYLRIGLCCSGYGANRFWVVNDYVTPPAAGLIKWNFYSNFGANCGLSDIGRQGGLPGSDNRLDNNDFIVFIERYFLQATTADIGRQGGISGQDGLYDNNDFVVFIDQYFAAPASCR